MFNKVRKYLHKIEITLTALLMILVGSLTWSLTMVKSGIVYGYGMGFWGPNGHDGVWHIAVAKSLARGTWEMPIFQGATIKNYHIGYDLILSIIHKISTIPVVTLYFQIMPPLISLGIGYFAYKFIKKWKGEKQALWSLFFIYFGGGFGWVVTLFRSGIFGGESMFWSQQAISTLINPPFALSLLFVFAGLNYLYEGLKQNEKKYLVTAAILFGALAQIKIYAAILVLGGLFFIGFWKLIKREGLAVIKVFMGSLTIALVLTLPFLDLSANTFVFRPFWFLQTMVGSPDRLFWLKLASAMMNYQLAGNWLKYGLATIVSFFIFWYGNLGTRFIWEIDIADKLVKKRKINYIETLIVFMILMGVLIPMLFVQSGTPWNTIQFFYYSLALSGILAGVGMAKWFGNISIPILHSIGICIVVLVTIPTTLSTLWLHYLPGRPPAMIGKSELEALTFLKQQPDGIVLTVPFDRDAAIAEQDNPPRPLYLYESTAYVSAFSDKQVFLEDEVNLNITGYDWSERKLAVQKFFETDNTNKVGEFLKENDIKYIYLVDFQKEDFPTDTSFTEKIFDNDEVVIYKTNLL
ncbi:hypothetical protein JXA63_01850 [Candidatus Woesebacteria bacterium]|nr:hypothetical protein [Candidatus Woesebacteria bacterium]